MYDLNFFSILSKQSQKNRTIRNVGIILLVFIIVINVLLIGFGYFAFKKMENHINTNQRYIDAPSTKAKVLEVEIMNREATIASEYLAVIKEVSAKIDKTNIIKVELLDYIRGLAPVKTFFRRAEYDDANINLDCFSTDISDPMNFYHRLLQDNRFSHVSLPGFIVNSDGAVTFSIQVTVKGGESS